LDFVDFDSIKNTISLSCFDHQTLSVVQELPFSFSAGPCSKD
jgi:hypothetical protein